jgi:hypothetical protein
LRAHESYITHDRLELLQKNKEILEAIKGDNEEFEERCSEFLKDTAWDNVPDAPFIAYKTFTRQIAPRIRRGRIKVENDVLSMTIPSLPSDEEVLRYRNHHLDTFHLLVYFRLEMPFILGEIDGNSPYEKLSPAEEVECFDNGCFPIGKIWETGSGYKGRWIKLQSTLNYLTIQALKYLLISSKYRNI